MIFDWKYKNKIISEINDMKKYEPNVWGFVYMMTLRDKKSNEIKYQYIGKKNIYSKRKRNFGKKEILQMKDKRSKKYEYVISESNWKSYISSNNFIKTNYNSFNISREIILFSTNDMDLKYKEAKEIICQNALEDNNFLNEGVSIRKFKQRVI
jgi:hypothetical protein